MRSRRATAICRGPTSRPSARHRGICILAGTCGHPCTAARRSERFSTLMNGLVWGWLLAIVTAAFVGGR